ncbi:MAG: OsmC family protein, partial [Pseudomonadota bacterium]
LNFGDKLAEIKSEGVAEVSLAGRPFTIKKQFLEDISSQNVLEAAKALKKPLAVFHAPRDQTVGIDHASKLFAAAMHPKSFISLDQADHLLTVKDDAAHVANVLGAWAARYASSAGATAPDDLEPEPLGAVSRSSDGRRMAQDVLVSGHHLIIDGGKEDGGDDLGPNPTKVVEAALAACASITMRLYADRKGWPLERATVRVRPTPGAEQDAHVLRFLEKEIKIEGDLDEAQRARLIEIADRCPVHRMLTEEVVISASATHKG